jgi:hypothetical protein
MQALKDNRLFAIPPPEPGLQEKSIISKSLSVLTWLDQAKENPELLRSVHETLSYIVEYLKSVDRFKIETQQFNQKAQLSSNHELCQPDSLVMAFKAFVR